MNEYNFAFRHKIIHSVIMVFTVSLGKEECGRMSEERDAYWLSPSSANEYTSFIGPFEYSYAFFILRLTMNTIIKGIHSNFNNVRMPECVIMSKVRMKHASLLDARCYATWLLW